MGARAEKNKKAQENGEDVTIYICPECEVERPDNSVNFCDPWCNDCGSLLIQDGDWKRVSPVIDTTEFESCWRSFKISHPEIQCKSGIRSVWLEGYDKGKGSNRKKKVDNGAHR